MFYNIFFPFLPGRGFTMLKYLNRSETWKKKKNLSIKTLSNSSLCLTTGCYIKIAIYIYFLLNDVEDIVVFLGLKVLYSDNSYMFSCSRNAQVTFVENPQLKIIRFQNDKLWNLIHALSGFKRVTLWFTYCHLCIEGNLKLC